MNKIAALWALFRKGEEIANAAKWKNGTITANALAAVVLALGMVGNAFGLDSGVNNESAAAIGGGLLALGNIVMHIVTSRKIGLPARGAGDDAGSASGNDAAG